MNQISFIYFYSCESTILTNRRNWDTEYNKSTWRKDNLKKWKQSIPLSNNDNKNNSNSNNSNGNGNNDDDDDNNLYLHMIKIWAIQLVGLCYKIKKT